MNAPDMIHIAVGYSPEATPENAGAIRTALLAQFVQLSQKFSQSAIEPSVGRIALQWIPQATDPNIPTLEGMRDALLAPRDIVRGEDGTLTHDAIPAMDEGTNVQLFLEAFGLEVAFVTMDGDIHVDRNEAFHENGEDDCSFWTPTTPEGNGWLLTEIYITEDGPAALFVRDAYAAARERREAERDARRDARRAAAADRRDLHGSDDDRARTGPGHDDDPHIIMVGAPPCALNAALPDLTLDLEDTAERRPG